MEVSCVTPRSLHLGAYLVDVLDPGVSDSLNAPYQDTDFQVLEHLDVQGRLLYDNLKRKPPRGSALQDVAYKMLLTLCL
jgi:hypothetical protein